MVVITLPFANTQSAKPGTTLMTLRSVRFQNPLYSRQQLTSCFMVARTALRLSKPTRLGSRGETCKVDAVMLLAIDIRGFE